MGHAVAKWLKHYATSRNGALGRVYSATNRKEYQKPTNNVSYRNM
jgi:hypothetical protein